MAKKRITVTLDRELDKKIRNFQVRLISSTQSGWSYSRVLETVAEEGLGTKPIKRLKTKAP